MLSATGIEAEAREQQNPRTTTNQKRELEPDSFHPAFTRLRLPRADAYLWTYKPL